MIHTDKKYQKYLPSKTFTLITSIGVVLAVIVFMISFLSSKGEKFGVGREKDTLPLKVENLSVVELIQNDSDQDSIPDWEEALWGTDKNKKITFGDTPDAAYIGDKKKELNIGTRPSADTDEKDLTETEKFAREFFASYSAMKSSGQIDRDTIAAFSSSLGQNIVNQNLTDRYDEEDIKINADDGSLSRQEYYESMQKLFQGYLSLGLGDELEIIGEETTLDSEDMATGETEQYAKLFEIAGAYQNFAEKAMDMPVSSSLARYHLQIANSANNTGISVANMAKMVIDPIVGLSGLSQYQKYSEELVQAVTDLETALSELSEE